jgi:hypothetical protein
MPTIRLTQNVSLQLSNVEMNFWDALCSAEPIETAMRGRSQTSTTNMVLARTCTLNHQIYAFLCSIADRMHLSDNLTRIFKLLLKSNRKTKHLYSLKERLTRKLHRSQKKTDPRVLRHLRHQPANHMTVSPILNARNVANLVTSPSIALRKRKRLLQRRSIL